MEGESDVTILIPMYLYLYPGYKIYPGMYPVMRHDLVYIVISYIGLGLDLERSTKRYEIACKHQYKSECKDVVIKIQSNTRIINSIYPIYL